MGILEEIRSELAWLRQALRKKQGELETARAAMGSAIAAFSRANAENIRLRLELGRAPWAPGLN